MDLASVWILSALLLYGHNTEASSCSCLSPICGASGVCSCEGQLTEVTSSQGTSFILMFMENNAEQEASLEVFVSSAWDVPVQFNITQVESSRTISLTLDPRQVQRVAVNESLMQTGNGRARKAILVEATKAVVVYALNKKGYSTDGFLVLPTNVLGREYYLVMYYKPLNWQQFAVVSLEENTQVNITFAGVGEGDRTGVSWNGERYRYGQTLSITMNQYDTTQLQSKEGNGVSNDISGTMIISSKPIAVFSGNVRTSIPYTKKSRDHLVEQLVPTSSWGTDFVLVLINSSAAENYLSITAMYDNTHLYFGNSSNRTVSSGETLHISFKVAEQLHASQPIQVVQYTPSSLYGAEDEGDPSMIVIPALDNYDYQYIFSTPTSGPDDAYKDFVYIAILQGMETGLTINERPLTGVLWKSIEGQFKMIGGVLRVGQGQFRIKHTRNVPFMCLLYGLRDRESYALNAGGVFSQNSAGQISPSVSSVRPSDEAYGPVSGGTLLVISGAQLSLVSEVRLISSNVEDALCVINRDLSNSTAIVCKTSRVTSPGVRDLVLIQEQVSVDGSIPCKVIYRPEVTFTYKLNPIVGSVSPLPARTFAGGGIKISFDGENMDSVHNPWLAIVELDKRGGKNDTTVHVDHQNPCVPVNGARLTCVTPEMKLDGNSSNRVRRQTKSHAEDYYSSEEHIFYIGLILDGVDGYSDLRVILGDDGNIIVAKNPEFEEFEEDPYIHYTDKRSTIEVKGLRLNLGASVSDYTVQIGSGDCDVIDLGYNYLECRPPSTQPDNLVDPSRETVPLDVGVGHRQGIRIGNLIYSTGTAPVPVWVIGVIVVIVVVLIFIAVAVACAWRRCAMGDREKTIMKHQMLDIIDGQLRRKVSPFLIPPHLLERGTKIGEGHFGVVYRGTLFNEQSKTYKDVAVKGFGASQYTVQDAEAFLVEAVKLQGMEHANLLTVLGITVEENRPFIVLPLMDHGDMKTFLVKPEQKLTVGDLVFFGYQVAIGMEYLEKNKIVHADLAARNCMIDKHFVVKIADFGLSKTLTNVDDYYTVKKDSQPMPVKWLALECLTHGKLSSKSDVWAYGILLWEFLTRGQSPYPNISNKDVQTYLKSGERMAKPEYCPVSVYDVMQRCWFGNPDYRPSFLQLKNELSNLLSITPGSTDNVYVRNVTTSLPDTYYLNQAFTQTSRQYIADVAYTRLEDGYINDAFSNSDPYSQGKGALIYSTPNVHEMTIAATGFNSSTAF